MQQCSFCRFYPIPGGVRHCPRCAQDLSVGLPVADRVVTTTVSERVLEAVRGEGGTDAPPAPRRVTLATRLEASPGTQPAADSGPLKMRPLHRPPMAVVCAFDDGEEQGEWFRVRRSRCVIGRAAGDIVIPHDPGISGRHAELVREPEAGWYVWYLRDLNSANGTFVRCSDAKLKHGSELLIGCGRFRFELRAAGAGEEDGEASPVEDGEAPLEETGRPMATRIGLPRVTGPEQDYRRPMLVELGEADSPRRLAIAGTDCWIGRNPGESAIDLGDDRFVDGRHVRIHRDERGHWCLHDPGSLNGTWLRIDELPLVSDCECRISEQRFLIRLV